MSIKLGPSHSIGYDLSHNPFAQNITECSSDKNALLRKIQATAASISFHDVFNGTYKEKTTRLHDLFNDLKTDHLDQEAEVELDDLFNEIEVVSYAHCIRDLYSLTKGAIADISLAEKCIAIFSKGVNLGTSILGAITFTASFMYHHSESLIHTLNAIPVISTIFTSVTAVFVGYKGWVVWKTNDLVRKLVQDDQLVFDGTDISLNGVELTDTLLTQELKLSEDEVAEIRRRLALDKINDTIPETIKKDIVTFIQKKAVRRQEKEHLQLVIAITGLIASVAMVALAFSPAAPLAVVVVVMLGVYSITLTNTYLSVRIAKEDVLHPIRLPSIQFEMIKLNKETTFIIN